MADKKENIVDATVEDVEEKKDEPVERPDGGSTSQGSKVIEPLKEKEIHPTVQAPKAPPKTLLMGEKGLEVDDLTQLAQFAGFLGKSNMLPKAFQRKGNSAEEIEQQRANIGVAVLWGRELGLNPMASLNGIAVINGTPSVWGDALPGLCYSAGVIEDHIEIWEGTGNDRIAICRVKRKGQTTYHEQRFSAEDARRAGLWSKDTYKAYPDRMLMNRARAFAFRTKFADVLRGLPIAEELQDYPQVTTEHPQVAVVNDGRSKSERLAERLAQPEEEQFG